MVVKISPRERKWIQKKLLNWFQENQRDFPWRNTIDPYRITIAEILLRQTFSKKVVPVYERLIEEYPDVFSLSVANYKEIEKAIHPLGLLYRAKQLVHMASEVVRNYDGIFPQDRKQLKALPGVGQYTSSAILCFSYGQYEALVDVNILRVYRRFFGLGEHSTSIGPDKQIYEISKSLLPMDTKAREYNLALLDFAAAVCTHYSPGCKRCPLNKRCIFFAVTMNEKNSTL